MTARRCLVRDAPMPVSAAFGCVVRAPLSLTKSLIQPTVPVAPGVCSWLPVKVQLTLSKSWVPFWWWGKWPAHVAACYFVVKVTVEVAALGAAGRAFTLTVYFTFLDRLVMVNEVPVTIVFWIVAPVLTRLTTSR